VRKHALTVCGITQLIAWMWWRKDFPLAVMFGRAYHTRSLHILNQPGGAVITDPQLPLYAGDRGSP